MSYSGIKQENKDLFKTRTDVLLGVNCPFITLTESKMGNVWYHDTEDFLCHITARGFRVLKHGSKSALIKRNML
tara:strand:+ start:466 stop:687 length:222 start_codon:yes stop_codon:yes gene_type:complete